MAYLWSIQMEIRLSISSNILLLKRVILIAEVVVVVVADDTIFSLFFKIVRIVEVDKFNAMQNMRLPFT